MRASGQATHSPLSCHRPQKASEIDPASIAKTSFAKVTVRQLAVKALVLILLFQFFCPVASELYAADEQTQQGAAEGPTPQQAPATQEDVALPSNGHSVLPEPAHSPVWAVIGDSLSTGAAASDRLQYDSQQISRHLLADTRPSNELGAPDAGDTGLLHHMLSPSVRLANDPIAFSAKLLNWLLANRYFNQPRLSWIARLASSSGNPSMTLLNAAQNGSRMRDGVSQLDAVLQSAGGVWPERIFIFFTGNDLCQQHPDELGSAVSQYSVSLRESLDFIAGQGKISAAGTTVDIVLPLVASQLAHREEILGKPVQAFGGATTCGQLMKDYFRPAASNAQEPPADGGGGSELLRALLQQLLPPNYAQMCPTLFFYPQLDARHLTTIANANRSLQDEVTTLIAARNAALEIPPGQTDDNARAASTSAMPSITFRLLQSTRDLLFNAEDIANDCFHLSARGHDRLATSLAEEMQTFENR